MKTYETKSYKRLLEIQAALETLEEMYTIEKMQNRRKCVTDPSKWIWYVTIVPMLSDER